LPDIVDQPWYFHGWQHDSSIRAMLVMLPVVKNKRSDNIYIKMSFRGKSLTLFENFKAHFETLPNSTCLAHADDRALSCGRFSARDSNLPF
jgi:hypothetical protein